MIPDHRDPKPREARATDPTTPGRTRVLFMAEAVTLAHVARVHALAQLLGPEYDIHLACDGRYDTVVAPEATIARVGLQSISTSDFSRAIETGRPIYDRDTLVAYVDADLRILDAIRPDVVVGDFRLSLNVSARLAGVPYINVTNAGWSPYTTPRFLLPDGQMERMVGLRVGQWLFDLARPTVFAAHAKPLNAVRATHGMAPLRGGLQEIYTDADAVLYADLESLFPTTALPPSHCFLGPILWSTQNPLPDWWSSVPSDRPIIYVNLGSSGPGTLLPRLLDLLAPLPVTVIAATAGRIALPTVPPNAFVSNFLPGDAASRRAAVVICNGGSPSSYQALAAGVPVLGIPTNLDQLLNIQALVKTGAARSLRRATLGPSPLSRALDQLQAGDARSASARLAADIATTVPRTVLVATIDALLGDHQPADFPATTWSPVSRTRFPKRK